MTTPASPSPELNYDELDPGIREVVRLLNHHGFETTDSGDGVSKPADWYQPDERGITEAFPYPHVICTVPVEAMIPEAKRLAALLGTEWHIEASYSPADGLDDRVVLMASRLEVVSEAQYGL